MGFGLSFFQDVPSFARLSKTLQHGWIRPNLAITYHGETESGLLSAVAALGDRIDRVRELELTFYSVSGEDARNHGDAIGRFTGLRVLTLNGGTRCRDIAVHALLSRRLVNLKCLKCSASDPEGLIPRAIRETSDAHALLAAVDLTCDPRHLAAEPSEWLGRLRLLRVYDEGTSGHHHVYTELLRKCSVLEQLRVFGYHIRAAQFTDEWAVATFTGSTSKVKGGAPLFKPARFLMLTVLSRRLNTSIWPQTPSACRRLDFSPSPDAAQA